MNEGELHFIFYWNKLTISHHYRLIFQKHFNNSVRHLSAKLGPQPRSGPRTSVEYRRCELTVNVLTLLVKHGPY